jgi:hypothetical protein
MKKVTIFFVVVSCLVITVSSFAFALNAEDSLSILFRAGIIEREFGSSNLGDDVFVETKDFAIYENEIAKGVELFILTGMGDSREEVVSYLLRREILYSEATNQGFSASPVEIRDMISYNTEAARTSLNYESDFLSYLDALGMTNEEYWESQYDAFEKRIATSKFTTAQRDRIREILYNEALSQGFTASHEEIRDLMDFNIEHIRSAPFYEGFYSQELESIGLTLEEYWESQYDVLKHEVTIIKYLSAHGITISDPARYEAALNINELIVHEAVEKRLESYLQELIDNYIVENDLQRVLRES